ncbi:MAG: hypothetical protein ACWGQW_20025, partial [bacterium]
EQLGRAIGDPVFFCESQSVVTIQVMKEFILKKRARFCFYSFLNLRLRAQDAVKKKKRDVHKIISFFMGMEHGESK